MDFAASAEVFAPAYPALNKIRVMAEKYLNNEFASSNLFNLNCQLRYVPIAMPPGMRERYPARSKLLKRERIYDCAPQLDYDVFVSGAFEAQILEYFRGIAECTPYLVDLGASPDQVAEFERILAAAPRCISSTQQD